MVKKEFTEIEPRAFNEKSDVELIEDLNKGTYSPAKMNVIMSILGLRSKKVNQYLTELVKKSNRITGMQNWIMILLTMVILILTGALVWAGFKIR